MKSSNATPLRFEIFVISLAAILLEVSYTRVFSFKLVYYFTYLIIGIALLGLGAGAVAAACLPWLRSARSRVTVGQCGIGAAIAVALSYLVVSLLQVNAGRLISAISGAWYDVIAFEGAKLGLLCFVLFLPFMLVGVAIAVILATRSDSINRLYFADLAGAALGCALVVPAMQILSPPGCVMLAGGMLALSAVRWNSVASIAIAAVLLGFASFPGVLPDPVADSTKTISPQNMEGQTVLFSQWSPVFRVDAVELQLPEGERLRLIHDGLWGSIIPKFDGNVEALTRYDSNIRALPFALLPENPDVTIIGSAGGNEIQASLYFGAERIRGIELNPVTISLLTDHFADYSGRVAEHPKVEIHNAEGRSFIARDPEAVDLIWFVAPDSYAAMNAATSGAFVLSESYLYTVEMIELALRHLTPDGIVCAQFGEVRFEVEANRTGRYLASAREAFRRLGIDDFARHVMVTTSKSYFTASTILLSVTPFDEADARALAEAVAKDPDGRVHYSLLERDPDFTEADIIDLPQEQLAEWFDQRPTLIHPITDDAPFFWHFVRFRDALAPSSGINPEKGFGEQLLVVLLLIATVFALIFLGIPFAARSQVWREIPNKPNAALYFAALGAGFMLLEVTLIQRLTLLLGYPTYSLTVTLFSLLVFTGLGSLACQRFDDVRRILPWMVGLLGALVAFYAFALAPLVDQLIGLPFAARILAAMILLTPLGLCLGVFMPLGLRTVAGWTEHSEEYIAWAWAVNGFFSVVSSVGSSILAMTFGFTFTILAAYALYIVGTAALLSARVESR